MFDSMQVASLIGWPFPENGIEPPDSFYQIQVKSNDDDDVNCYESCFKHTPTSGLNDNHVLLGFWKCQEECGTLKKTPFDVNQLKQSSKVLLLMTSRGFSDFHHNAVSFRKVQDLLYQNRNLVAFVYDYGGWMPTSETFIQWWEQEHQGLSQRPWQSDPQSFGGWGRCTLSLIAQGTIEWDVFDLVHSSKHSNLLSDISTDHDGIDDALPFLEANDFEGALEAVRTHNHAEYIPFQVCVYIASRIYGNTLQGMIKRGDERLLDVMSEYCEPPQHEKHDYELEHKSDIDFEENIKMARDIGIIGEGEKLRDRARQAWRDVMEHVASSECESCKKIALHVALVPTYSKGIEDGHGRGDRTESILVSLCFRNESIDDLHSLHHRYKASGTPMHFDVNSDIFFALLPYSGKTSQELLRNLKLLLADIRASFWREHKSWEHAYSIAGLIFGSGIVDNELYEDLSPFWSDVEYELEFPDDSVTHKTYFGQGETMDFEKDEL